MHPILIDFGSWDLPFLGGTHLFLPTYGFLFALAVVLAWSWFVRRARTLRLPEDRLFQLIFASVLAGILGAKVLLLIVDWRTYWERPVEILGTLRSAGVLIGGVVAGAATFAVYARRYQLPIWPLADAVAAPIALAQAVGRLGCFAAGCCWGVRVRPDHWLAVVFTSEDAHRQTGVPLHDPRLATQLIEFAFDLALCGVLTLLWRRRLRPAGSVFWLYVLFYGIGRSTIELWRGDVQRGLYLGQSVSTSQLLAFVGALVAAIVLARGWVGLARQDRPSSA